MRSRNNLARAPRSPNVCEKDWLVQRAKLLEQNLKNLQNSDENKIDKYDQFAVEGCCKYLH